MQERICEKALASRKERSLLLKISTFEKDTGEEGRLFHEGITVLAILLIMTLSCSFQDFSQIFGKEWTSPTLRREGIQPYDLWEARVLQTPASNYTFLSIKEHGQLDSLENSNTLGFKCGIFCLAVLLTKILLERWAFWAAFYRSLVCETVF